MCGPIPGKKFKSRIQKKQPKNAFANIREPDQPQPNAASDQDICCLLLNQAFELHYPRLQVSNVIEPDQMQCCVAVDLAL